VVDVKSGPGLTPPGAGFKGQRPGQSPRGLHKTEVASAYFAEAFAS
jgi:hypothetical protein